MKVSWSNHRVVKHIFQQTGGKKNNNKNANNLVPYLCQLRTVYSKMSCGILLVLTQANPDSAKSVKQNHFLSINLILIHDNRQLRKVS